MSEKLTVIDGVKYREVSRKAKVGERILIVNAEDTYGAYENGDVFIVEKVISYGGVECKSAASDCDGNRDGFITDEEYVVLEPVATEDKPKDDLRAQVDGLTQTVASLTLRVTELERAKLPIVVFAPKRPKTRDEIVEMAKEDVAELALRYQSSSNTSIGRSFWPEGCEKYGLMPTNFVEFVVNREKRTVVALIRYLESKSVKYREVAKCAPDDCFNAHIGKAIALRRALGLTVPSEYYEAPQPTEIHVGDVITWDVDFAHYVVTKPEKAKGSDKLRGVWCTDGATDWKAYACDFEGARIIDDSREEVSA